MPVSPLEKNFYAQWRLQCGKAFFLGESNPPLPERLLQIVWYHQRLLRDQLRTLDGKPVRVLHPGFWNHEAGPDFRGAIVQFDDEPAKSGDVEIDLFSEGWKSHGHDRNPNFSNVILHVVWNATNNTGQPSRGGMTTAIPVLELKPVLDSPIIELSRWLGSESAQTFPKNLAGECCGPLKGLSEEKLGELLREAAFVRFQRKANDLQARARQAGWEQALWEGIFRALGYKNNIWPMQRLAELLANSERRAEALRTFSKTRAPLFWQAWLFGISGLLPTQPEDVGDDNYLRSIWDIWWRERNSHNASIFPNKLWCFSGMRPANSPQRRLALAAHWLADAQFFSKLENWFTKEDAASASPTALLDVLGVEQDEFWSRHWNFRSPTLKQRQPLIGSARVSDLAINVILPWFWIRAVTGKSEKLQERAEKIYFNWPASDDNATLRLARQRLFAGNIAARKLKTAAAQQGLLQIVRDFCEHSNAVCAECQFPDLVRGWNLKGQKIN